MGERVLVVTGAGPVTVNMADYDIVVFNASHSPLVELGLYPQMPDHLDPNLLMVRVVEPVVIDYGPSRPAWKDPWPGKRRRR